MLHLWPYYYLNTYAPISMSTPYTMHILLSLLTVIAGRTHGWLGGGTRPPSCPPSPRRVLSCSEARRAESSFF